MIAVARASQGGQIAFGKDPIATHCALFGHLGRFVTLAAIPNLIVSATFDDLGFGQPSCWERLREKALERVE